ncbi:hypothetical protein OUZ56_010140 [Daphnia magna]|uniref:Myb-like domain-containing protein n=1 Tax=Daphnia magna TaxID=35525 RepID=A0ABR0AHW8_9CRUS|nr:hypothetical protein OUZ56_010140 [Daphnia magna]
MKPGDFFKHWSKNMIWEDIGEEMKTNGYKTSEGNKPGVICSQKWNYVWKTYKNFTLLVEKTGSGADVLHMKPQFYNEIREILENKNPPFNENDGEALNKIHFSDDECDEGDYDEKHVEPRSKKRERNCKGSNVEKMLNILAVISKKKERMKDKK